MTVLEQKEAIREVIDRFSTLEIDVKEQAKRVHARCARGGVCR